LPLLRLRHANDVGLPRPSRGDHPRGSGDFHIAATSPARDAGMRFNADLTSSASVVDVDGDCRVGEIDLGADELP
jgi:hypothetical protein